MREGKGIKIIEWEDLNKKKFYMNSLALAISIRSCIYPLNLVKTRLQADESSKVYRGMGHAFKDIVKREGMRGLYKGFPISLFHVVAGQFYLTTYELSKQFLYRDQRTSVQHMCAGFTASLVSQTIMVPVDIISQHQQMRGTRNIPPIAAESRSSKAAHSLMGQSFRIGQKIVSLEGFRGLYRGYSVSLLTYGSNSALYWLFYYWYSEFVEEFLTQSLHSNVREFIRIGTSGVAASLTACVITNPLDVIRTRLQLQMKSTGEVKGALEVYRHLMRKEGYMGLGRGLVARMTQSSFTSIFVILGYEYVKKLSLKDELIVDDDGKRYNRRKNVVV